MSRVASTDEWDQEVHATAGRIAARIARCESIESLAESFDAAVEKNLGLRAKLRIDGFGDIGAEAEGKAPNTEAVLESASGASIGSLRLSGAEVTPALRDALALHLAGRLQLILSLERAIRDNAAKDDFLSVSAHELRTPLSTILGWAKLLIDDKAVTEPRVKKGLEVVHRNAQAEAKLVDEMVDSGRLLRRKIKAAPEVQLLAPRVQNAVEAARAKARERSIEIVAELDESARANVDGQRLEQLLSHLISNAIEHGPAVHGQKANIRVSLRREGSSAVIEVIDQGPGLTPLQLRAAFDRLRNPTTKRHGGHGLGLTFASRLAELLEGTLSATSEGEGHGATFSLKIPAV